MDRLPDVILFTLILPQLDFASCLAIVRSCKRCSARFWDVLRRAHSFDDRVFGTYEVAEAALVKLVSVTQHRFKPQLLVLHQANQWFGAFPKNESRHNAALQWILSATSVNRGVQFPNETDLLLKNNNGLAQLVNDEHLRAQIDCWQDMLNQVCQIEFDTSHISGLFCYFEMQTADLFVALRHLDGLACRFFFLTHRRAV